MASANRLLSMTVALVVFLSGCGVPKESKSTPSTTEVQKVEATERNKISIDEPSREAARKTLVVMRRMANVDEDAARTLAELDTPTSAESAAKSSRHAAETRARMRRIEAALNADDYLELVEAIASAQKLLQERVDKLRKLQGKP